MEETQEEAALRGATVCPECGGRLENFVDRIGMLQTNGYCPKCNIIRAATISDLFLCVECHSCLFIARPGDIDPDNKAQCWFCKGEMAHISSKNLGNLERIGMLKKGYFLNTILLKKTEEIAKQKAKCKHLILPEDLVFLQKGKTLHYSFYRCLCELGKQHAY